MRGLTVEKVLSCPCIWFIVTSKANLTTLLAILDSVDQDQAAQNAVWSLIYTAIFAETLETIATIVAIFRVVFLG